MKWDCHWAGLYFWCWLCGRPNFWTFKIKFSFSLATRPEAGKRPVLASCERLEYSLPLQCLSRKGTGIETRSGTCWIISYFLRQAYSAVSMPDIPDCCTLCTLRKVITRVQFGEGEQSMACLVLRLLKQRSRERQNHRCVWFIGICSARHISLSLFWKQSLNLIYEALAFSSCLWLPQSDSTNYSNIACRAPKTQW